MTGSSHWPKQVSAPARPSFSTPPSFQQSSGPVRQRRRLGPASQLVLVETVCDEETVAARLAARAVQGDSPSDATLSIFRQQLASGESCLTSGS